MADEDEEEDKGPVEASLDGDDEGEEGEDSEGEGGGSNKKMMLIIVAALLLLVGGGAGAYFTGMLDSVLGGGSESGEHKDEHGDGHGDDHASADDHGDDYDKEHGDGGKKGGGPAFLVIPDQRVNLNSSDGGNAFLQLSVQLELKNEDDKKKVEAVLPRVIDQFQTYLRELRVQDLRGSQGPQRLAVELLIRVNQAAAPVEVQDVLFQEILIQEN